jgi:hypothetical protein
VNRFKRYLHTLSSLACAALLSGLLSACSFLEDSKVDYKSASKQASTLEVPPDLTQLRRDSRYQVSGANSALAIVNSTALYEYEPRAPESMHDWFAARASRGYPVLGIEADDGSLLGFASYGVFRGFAAFQYTVEHSVYVHVGHRGCGRLSGRVRC